MKNIVRVLVCAALAVGLVAGPGIAQGSAATHAQKAAKAKRLRAAKRLLKGAAANAFIMRQTAKDLNVTVKQLRQELKGTTLAAVIVNHGQTAADVEAKIVAAFKAKLDPLVTAQKLKQAREDALVSRFQKHVDKVLNHQFAKAPSAKAPGARAARIAVGLVLRKAAADYLALTVAQLRQQLPGHSLADLANAQSAQGKSAQGLEDAMVAAVQAKLAKAVSNQRLSQAKADKILANVQNHVGDVVNKVHPA